MTRHTTPGTTLARVFGTVLNGFNTGVESDYLVSA
jgi:hypothetical protein